MTVMVTTPIAPAATGETQTLETHDLAAPVYSLEEWMQNPPDHAEWVNGELIEKEGMTLKHGQIQARLSRQWSEFKDSQAYSQALGGEVYTDTPCRTAIQGRRPDVSYLTPTLFSQHGNSKVLPQSFPLCAEIVSPTDLAEEVIAKAQEYLQSGGEEVWLVFPESRWVIVVTQEARLVFASGEVAKTQKILLGFEIAVDTLVQ
jgi:Uma2 family endonuclease